MKKNGDLHLADWIKYPNKKVWWKCKRGHSWKTSIINRRFGRNCPYCEGKVSIRTKGEKDLICMM